jgi:hypothetical protein
MNLRSALLSLVITSIATSAFAADTNSFLLINTKSGKVMGKAAYSIDTAKNGVLRIRSHWTFQLHTGDLPGEMSTDAGVATGRQITPGNTSSFVDGQFSSDYKIDPNGDYISGYIQDGSSLIMTSYTPNKTRTAVAVSSVQAGNISETRDVPIPKPGFVVAPDLDPSAIQALVTTAITHPHPDSTYLLLNPAGVSVQPGSEMLYVTIQPVSGVANGTLDGKPVVLKRYLMNFHTSHALIFVDDTGDLMEVQMGPLSTNYVRDKFALNP